MSQIDADKERAKDTYSVTGRICVHLRNLRIIHPRHLRIPTNWKCSISSGRFLRLASRRQPPSEPLLEGPLTRLLTKERSRWDQARFAASGGPHVLLATSTGGHPSVTQVESLLAMALTLRGARVSLLLCDAALPACEECMLIVFKSVEQFAADGPSPSRCAPCFGNGQKLYDLLGLQVLRYSSFLDDASREEGRADQSRNADG